MNKALYVFKKYAQRYAIPGEGSLGFGTPLSQLVPKDENNKRWPYFLDEDTNLFKRKTKDWSVAQQHAFNFFEANPNLRKGLIDGTVDIPRPAFFPTHESISGIHHELDNYTKSWNPDFFPPKDLATPEDILNYKRHSPDIKLTLGKPKWSPPQTPHMEFFNNMLGEHNFNILDPKHMEIYKKGIENYKSGSRTAGTDDYIKDLQRQTLKNFDTHVTRLDPKILENMKIEGEKKFPKFFTNWNDYDHAYENFGAMIDRSKKELKAMTKDELGEAKEVLRRIKTTSTATPTSTEVKSSSPVVTQPIDWNTGSTSSTSKNKILPNGMKELGKITKGIEKPSETWWSKPLEGFKKIVKRKFFH